MSNELVDQEQQLETALAELNDRNKNVEVGPPKYIPRLQFCIAVSGAVKDGLVPINTYAMFQGLEPVLQLGKGFTGMFIDVRGRAEVEERGEKTIVFGDATKPAYAEIVAKELGRYVKHGPEVLLWVPEAQVFCTLHFGQNKSLHSIKDRIPGLMGKTVDFLQRPAEKKSSGDKWQAIRFMEATDQFDRSDIPTALLLHTLQQFTNPCDRFPEPEDDDR